MWVRTNYQLLPSSCKLLMRMYYSAATVEFKNTAHEIILQKMMLYALSSVNNNNKKDCALHHRSWSLSTQMTIQASYHQHYTISIRTCRKTLPEYILCCHAKFSLILKCCFQGDVDMVAALMRCVPLAEMAFMRGYSVLWDWLSDEFWIDKNVEMVTKLRANWTSSKSQMRENYPADE